MSLFAIADLHLSTDGSKSMEKFGGRWADYINRLEQNWTRLVRPEDTVILPGDISWGMRLEDALGDLRFLDALPGHKLIGKGNHDFWWATASKMQRFFDANDLSTLKILYNNAYALEGCIVCGTRGWFVEEAQQNTVGSVDYLRIVNREAERLRLSLREAKALQAEPGKEALPILVFLHFPPVWGEFVCRELVEVLLEYEIQTCYFGHIHGIGGTTMTRTYEGIRMTLVAADHLGFTPLPIFPG